MRIYTYDRDAESAEVREIDIEVPLRRLAADPDRVVAARWRKLLELVEFLGTNNEELEALGLICGNGLWITCGKRVAVHMCVDWYDFAPWKDGLPEMHYRLQVERKSATLSEDVRTQSREEAKRVILDAFGWS